eukprot:gnl/MRDRNA2_/MRDRNA2_80975_c0_seq3.p1 gnl/MRDRNA2_/MRDRNA2_80975_c0~~gnl/MRDRNA2_/MRDRNA2_80975_c0_seq3.p1  ORF type:complete len:182 (-),score=30.82 gnl/MRDRNA2_/MRDRNA2_80975_c0_seq3:132-677(-)
MPCIFFQSHLSTDIRHVASFVGDDAALFKYSELQHPSFVLTQVSGTPRRHHVGSCFLHVSFSTHHFDLHRVTPPQINHGNLTKVHSSQQGFYVQGNLDVQTSFLTPKQMKKMKSAKKMHKNAVELDKEVNGKEGKKPIDLLPGSKVDLSNLGFLDADPGSDVALQRGDHIGVEVLGMPDFL